MTRRVLPVGLLIFGILGLSAMSSVAADAAHGKKVYDTNCAACHGFKGDGKGPAAATLNPRPTDFTSGAVMKEIGDARMLKSIKEGRPGTAMVAWGGILKDQDIEDVIAYTRSLLKK
jgi:mono/diheme cytochrome c family protein